MSIAEYIISPEKPEAGSFVGCDEAEAAVWGVYGDDDYLATFPSRQSAQQFVDARSGGYACWAEDFDGWRVIASPLSPVRAGL